MKLSIIILNWNGGAMLRKYLPSVVKHSALADCEIVVADNGSTDDSLEFLHTFENNVRTVVFDRNYGFAEGYNRAIQQVEAEYVVLLNSDVEVMAGWLAPLIVFLDEHPEVAAVQPKILADTCRTHFEYAGAAGGFIDYLGYPYCRGRILGVVEQDLGQYDEPIPVFWTSGACMLVRRSAYLETGGLDADFFAHQEEIDLCWRLNSRGWKLFCVPESVVYHLGGGTLNYESPRKTFLNFRNNLLMLYKNLPQRSLWLVMVIRFMLDYVSFAQMLLTGKVKNAWAIVQARYAFWTLRPMFMARRNENIRQTKVVSPTTILRRSIILSYYIMGKRRFQSL